MTAAPKPLPPLRQWTPEEIADARRWLDKQNAKRAESKAAKDRTQLPLVPR